MNVTERQTMPARNSMAEAEHWLLCESIGGWSSQANEVRAARISGAKIGPRALLWLRGVAKSDTMKASWAQLILDALEREGQVPR